MDAQDRISVPAGAVFTVELTVAGGTGYRWEAARLPRGVALVREAAPDVGGSARVPDSRVPDSLEPASPPLAGGPVRQRFVFRATGSAGEELELEFVLRRPWEAKPVLRQAVRVAIQPPAG